MSYEQDELWLPNGYDACQPCPQDCPACQRDALVPVAMRSTQCHGCVTAAEPVIDAGWGCCTQCGKREPDGLVPWGQTEKLCWDCTDVQIDLLALALQDSTGLPVETKVVAQ